MSTNPSTRETTVPRPGIAVTTAPLAIVRRDLVRLIRNPGRTALSFAIPLVLATVVAVVFGGSGPPQITIRLLVWNEDEGVIGRFLEGAAGQGSTDERLELVTVGSEGLAMMDEGDNASALIHLPPGLSDDFLQGRPVTIELIKNPSQRFLPQLVQEGASVGAVILGQISRTFRNELAQLASMLETEGLPQRVEVAVMSSSIIGKLEEVERYVLPPIVKLETVTIGAEGEDAETNETRKVSAMVEVLSYFMPGLSMLAALFLAQSISRDVLSDRESGLLSHLLAAPVTAGQYLAGKTASVTLVSLLGLGLMICFGMAAGVSWGPPVAVGLLTLATAAATAGLLVLLMSLARTQRQGDAVTTVVIIVSSMLGGAFIPLTQIPGFLRPVTAISPVFWCVDGFNELMLRDGALTTIAPNLAVLSGAGLLMLLVGSLRLGRRIQGGA